MTGSSTWAAQQLAAFMASAAGFGHEDEARRTALQQAAEALDSEIAAAVAGGAVKTSIGYPGGTAPDERLADLAAHLGASQGDLGEIGVVWTCVVPVELGGDDERLVFARVGDAFTAEETTFCRAMGRALAMAVLMLRTIERERSLREATDALLSGLRERQHLLERLYAIQQSISHRMPVDDVLDAVTHGVAELLTDDVAGLRLVDSECPSRMVLVASSGIPASASDGPLRYIDVGQGAGGRAVREDRLVVIDDYAGSEDMLAPFRESGLQAAMAAPVRRDGQPIGALAVASYRPGRRYSESEQAILLAFAEHASLALNDASAVEAMRGALDELAHEATHDSLTGLPNRTLVLERLTQALGRPRSHGSGVGVLFVDLDHFKHVNDSLGHGLADVVLRRIAERLRASLRDEDTVGRLSGDEFLVVCDDSSGLGTMSELAERLRGVIAEPLDISGHKVMVTASVGVLHTADGSAEEVVRDADLAMYRAKEGGRARVEVFDTVMRNRLRERMDVEHALRQAIERRALHVHYQPIFNGRTGQPVAVEALARWDDPALGSVPPDRFIPVAEDTGMIGALGRLVLEQSCAEVATWRRSHPALADLAVAVNLSARQLSVPGFVDEVVRATEGSGLDLPALWLEITESVLMQEASETTANLAQLRGLGVHLAIDDFGTGYSSLSYLRRFAVDVVKIDQSFVAGLGVDEGDEAIVEAVIRLAGALDLQVVAEGIERVEHLDHLRDLGCDLVQGYLLGQPQGPVAALADLLAGKAAQLWAGDAFGRKSTRRIKKPSATSPSASPSMAKSM